MEAPPTEQSPLRVHPILVEDEVPVSFCSNWESLIEPIKRFQNQSENDSVPSRVEFGSSIFAHHANPAVRNPEAHVQQKTFAQLLSLLSPKLVALKICVDRNCVVDFKKSFYQALTEFPKLQVLQLSFRNILEAGHKGYCYIYSIGELMEKILSLSPVLTEVEICWDIWTEHVDYYEDRYLEKLPTSVRSLTLKKNLMRPITPQILSSIHLPALTMLSIDFSMSYLTSLDALKVFNAFRSSLTSLTVTHYEIKELSFPEFENLTTLELEIGPTVVLNPRVAFSTAFPRVTDLRLDRVKSGNVLKALFPSGFQAPEVTSLQIPEVVQSRESMVELILGCPGLKKLAHSAVASLDPLEPIFASMPGLTELRLNFRLPDSVDSMNVAGDATLTGLPDNLCVSLEESGNLESFHSQTVKLHPGLTDLKELRIIHVTASHPQPKLTNATAYCGFLKMKNLLELKTDKFKFTEKCLEDLQARFGNITPSPGVALRQIPH